MSCMWKRLYFQYIFYMLLWKWKILSNAMDDSAIVSDEPMESYEKETKNILTNFN